MDALLITNDINRYYITGFDGSAGYALITKGKSVLITDFRYTEQAKRQSTHFEVIQYEGSYFDAVNLVLKDQKVAVLGFEEHNVTYEQYLQYIEKIKIDKLIRSGRIIEELRMVKEADEIEKMRKAAGIADKAFLHIQQFIKPGTVEKDIALELEFFMKKNGASGLSFDTIVASGVRSSLPHGHASGKVIESGDLVTMDFGCIYEGYCSDMTRTVAVGKISEDQKKVYNIVLEAQMRALQAIVPTKTGLEIDMVARSHINSNGYEKNFGHGLGHGVGLEIHEEPRVSKAGDKILLPGMVVTVEPGIYIEGFCGVRIEDMVVVTEQGIENLTSSKKELLIL